MVDSSQLKASHLLVAYMEASGLDNVDTGKKLGKHAQWVAAKKRHPGYDAVLRQAQDEITSGIVANTIDLATKFDEEAENSFKTMVEIRDAAQELGSTRLKAAIEISDRAPNAPKKRTETYSEKVMTLQLPIQQVGYIREALTDTGDGDIVELLDYTIMEKEGRGEDDGSGGYNVTKLEDDDE